MARVEIKGFAWGYVVAEDGRPVQGNKPTLNTTVYAASTGPSTLTQGTTAFQTDAEGLLPGWLEEGTYTYTDTDGNTQTVEAVSGGTDARLDTIETARASEASDVARLAVTNEAPLNVEWAEYGAAAGASASANSTAINAAFAALPAAGGEILLPNDYSMNASVNLDDKRSIVIRGVAGRSAGAAPRSRLTFSGTGSGRFLSCRSTYGISIQDIWIGYSSGSYTGNLIDFSHSGTALDSGYNSIERCMMGGNTSSARSAVGVYANKAQSGSIKDSSILNCDIGVKGRSVNADYAANWKIDTVAFSANTSAHIRNAGNAWLVQNCTFEPLASGAAGAYDHDANVICNGITFISNWTGDVTSGTAAQFTVAGTDIVFIGNEIQSNGSGTGISIDNGLTNSTGIVITGNRFNSLTNGIVIAANVTRSLVGYNNFATVTNSYTVNGVTGADVDWVHGGADNLVTAHSLQATQAIRAGTFYQMLGTGGSGYLLGLEQSSDPSAPAADQGVVFFKDNGAGKTQLCVRFNTGAVQILATQP